MSTIRCGNKEFVVGERTLIMGILNVTPDSFSDGGVFAQKKYAVDHAISLLKDGADIIDIGGVATSPRAQAVDEDEELRRVLPVVETLVKEGIREMAIDTSSAKVARMALDAGASWINDQHAALKDPLMAEVMLKADAAVLMHNSGPPGVEAGERIVYNDIVKEIRAFFSERVSHLCAQGLSKEKLILDPGIGFGKGLRDSLEIINAFGELAKESSLTLVGVSRKSFIKSLTDIDDPKARDEASLGAAAAAIAAGAHIIRTHNAKKTFDMVRVFDACMATKRRRHNENLH